jgi:hypothetical protein
MAAKKRKRYKRLLIIDEATSREHTGELLRSTASALTEPFLSLLRLFAVNLSGFVHTGCATFAVVVTSSSTFSKFSAIFAEV